ncbi:MAG: ATP-binding protein [Thermodesulfovibrionales bacterium]|nr:ATP-binding protein [Thermodesulfovibrionales bacterium]
MIPFENILNNLQDSVLLFDTKGRLIYINKAGEELFLRSYKDLKERHFNTIFSLSKDIALLIKKTLEEGRAFKGRDMEMRDFNEVNIDIYACPFYEDNVNLGANSREIKGVLVSLKENTTLADPEDYYFDSLLYMLGSIAHEIKNPLSGIKGAAQLLLNNEKTASDSECIKVILKETDRLNSVLHSYLTMTVRPVLNQINIHEVVEHSLKVLSPLLKEKKIKVIKSYDPSLPDIAGDESKLLQVFINLFKNAIEALEAIKSNREIVVSSRFSNEYLVIYEKKIAGKTLGHKKKQKWVIITIKDNGMGIAQEEQKKIFLPFYTHKPNGSGLGLALSKKIIRDHGGLIKMKSVIGEGTIFYVYMPLRMDS